MKNGKLKNYYYKLRCFFLLLRRRNRLAKKNAEKLMNLVGSGYRKTEMRKAIQQGRFYDVQQLAYEHDKRARSVQQEIIVASHVPVPERTDKEVAKYRIDGLPGEFDSAGKVWEHWQDKQFNGQTSELKKKHTFRRKD